MPSANVVILERSGEPGFKACCDPAQQDDETTSRLPGLLVIIIDGDDDEGINSEPGLFSSS